MNSQDNKHHKEHHAKNHGNKETETKTENKHTNKQSKGLSESAKAYLAFSIVIGIALIGFIVFLLSRSGSTTSTGTLDRRPLGYTNDGVKVEFYVMSQCPYGTQVEDAIAPVLQSMGGAVDFRLDFITKETSPGVFQSLHGDPETKGNIAQLCARKYYPGKYFDLVICQNKDAKNVDTNWKGCADKLGMDSQKISNCLISEEGANLLRESIKRTEARGASGSPTIYINDVAYNGARDAISFQRAICQYTKHESCNQIPACASDADCTAETNKEGYCTNPGQKNAACEYKMPVSFTYTVLNQDTCSSCDSTRIMQVTQQLFMGAQATLVDIDSPEGKALAEKYNIQLLPAFIFDAPVTTTKSWTQIAELKTAFDAQSDGKYTLKPEATGASYFVSEEARQAHYDSIGVVKGDNKPQIDFFVMSYCPFGNQAEEGIKPVYDLLKGKAKFIPRYVIYSNYGGGGPEYCLPGDEICSMHGIVELNQNIREACVYKYNGEQAWFDFSIAMNTKCNSQNADTCWENVAKDLKLDTAKISKCQKEEGYALMKADLDLGNKLGVQGSPTIFIDGDAYNGARSPEGYKVALCESFDGTTPSECATKLAGEATAPAGGGAAGCGV